MQAVGSAGRRRSSASRITPTFSPRLLSTGNSAASRAVQLLPAAPLTASTAGCLKLSSAASARFVHCTKVSPSILSHRQKLPVHSSMRTARLHFAVPPTVSHHMAAGRTQSPRSPYRARYTTISSSVSLWRASAQHFVFVALEMPVAARLHMIFECFHVILFYTDTRHSGAECHIYNQYSIFQHGKKSLAGKMEKKAAAAKAGRQSWVLELPRHRCYTETIRDTPEKALKIKEKAL